MATKSELRRAAKAEADAALDDYIQAWTETLRSFILEGLEETEKPSEGEGDGRFSRQ